MVEGPLNIIDGGIWHPAAFQDLQPFLRRLLFDLLLDEAINLPSILDTVTVGNEPGIGLPLWVS